jgi:hypothetical protein
VFISLRFIYCTDTILMADKTEQMIQVCKTLMKNPSNLRQRLSGTTNEIQDKPAGAFQPPARPTQPAPASNNSSRKPNAMDMENR